MKDIRLANKGVHEKVISYFRDLKPGKVLDIPCGPGALSRSLKELGFDVSACDIHPEHIMVEGIEAVFCDMNKELPFESKTFDYVACVEGIEHTENPYNAIREISRVLKTGGRLMLTTPNYLNIEHRLRFLITGSLTKPVSMKRFNNFFGKDMSGMHNSPITYPILKFMLESNNLSILSIDREKLKKNQRFLMPIVLLIKAYTLLWSKDERKKYLIDAVNSDVIINGGNNLIIVCQKNNT
ncbi:MAG TPA: class I SAM-dependent methyltransferase [Deltaproteobacteria bacterium]|nr:class I SAM-dependent methyltransferase [Deltaproteobacteria bacterium]